MKHMTIITPCKITANENKAGRPAKTMADTCGINCRCATRASHLHGVIESFEHAHALRAELEVHGPFRRQGDALVLHRVLPEYDHHAGQHFLGRHDSRRLIGSPFIRLIYSQKSPSQSTRSKMQT